MRGQEDALERDFRGLGQTLQAVGDFRRDRNLKPRDFLQVVSRLGEWPTGETAGGSSVERRGPVAPASLGL